ncbi:hypothetical protein PIB30_051172 [Stylosanthes scabra]|uniref:Ubiquitin-like protease family profile domain-containing protein n=1 Tax=Stylosanthes scabra TaxID=79078 RepID=A0ABU6UGJ5_9FABA|nr:hypothetical protein [Stylosanthes scabra]
MHFKPRADLGFDVEATRLAVYIYTFIGDPREILFRHDIHDFTRDDLLSLKPRLTPSAVVVNTLALVASRNARRRTNATCWFLPSTFAADTLRGIVFVPIWDVDEAWYMMILDVKKPRVYSLDVHRTVENMARKEKQMKVVLRTLSLMFATLTHILNFTDRSPDTSDWGCILQASGIPEDLTSAETIIWAWSWLSHSGGFSMNIFGPLGDEDTLRIRLTSCICPMQ